MPPLGSDSRLVKRAEPSEKGHISDNTLRSLKGSIWRPRGREGQTTLSENESPQV